MAENERRLGDLVDDYCPRCRLLLNHAIASMVQTQIAKVICQTCFTEHAFRHGEGGKKKISNPRATLFDQVLAGATPSSPAAGTEAPAPKKKTGTPARYISRHKTKPPKKS
jgi:hypothetical protein